MADIDNRSGPIMGKRTPPQDLIPLEYQGIRYGVTHFTDHPCAQVEAIDIKTGKVLWTREVYPLRYDSELESDVQDVFITDMYIENERLVVINENNEEYMLDLQTGLPEPKV